MAGSPAEAKLPRRGSIVCWRTGPVGIDDGALARAPNVRAPREHGAHEPGVLHGRDDLVARAPAGGPRCASSALRTAPESRRERGRSAPARSSMRRAAAGASPGPVSHPRHSRAAGGNDGWDRSSSRAPETSPDMPRRLTSGTTVFPDTEEESSPRARLSLPPVGESGPVSCSATLRACPSATARSTSPGATTPSTTTRTPSARPSRRASCSRPAARSLWVTRGSRRLPVRS